MGRLLVNMLLVNMLLVNVLLVDILLVDTWLKDLRLGVRMLFKYRELTGTAVLALSLGIGLTTIMFTIVYGTLLRGLPFDEADQLVRLHAQSIQSGHQATISPREFLGWRERLGAFEDVAAWYGKSVNVSDPYASPARYNGAYISSNMLELLRVEPVLGRGFSSRGTERGFLIGYEAWQQRYGGDPRIVGQTIRVDGVDRSLLGVLPQGFGFPLRQEIWLPLGLSPETEGRIPLQVFGRLLPGIDAPSANADLERATAQLAQDVPGSPALSVTVEPYAATYTDESLRSYLYLMLGAVVGVLLIACANVTNLLLARVALRSRDMAVRSALGASRSRLVTQVLAETMVLALCGGLVGLILTKVGIDLYNVLMAEHLLSFWMDVRFDPQVFLFVLGTTLFASLVSGLWPALRTSGADAGDVLKDLSGGASGGRLGRFSRGIVIAEFAISCGLLVATGLMIKSLVNLHNFNPEFSTENMLTAQVALHRADYPTSESQLCFFGELEEQLAALPGVQSVAFGSTLPGKPARREPYEIHGESCCPYDRPTTSVAVVSDGFFASFGIEARRGRLFDESDHQGGEAVAIINETFAVRHFYDREPLGQRLRVGEHGERASQWRTIIGVVPDMAMGGMNSGDPAGVYVPMEQVPRAWMAVVLKIRGDPSVIGPGVHQAVAKIDRHLPLFWLKPMPEVLQEASWQYSTFSTLFMVFGAVAFLLAIIGLYGVVSLMAHQRIQECGLRMALGAKSDDVQSLIVRSGMAQLGPGVVLGLILAASLSKMMSALLFQVEPWDFTVFSFVAATLLATGLLACWIPAQRAARVDPMAALRDE